MKRSGWHVALGVCAAVSTATPGAELPRGGAEVADLESRNMPRSVVQERKLMTAPGDASERLKAAEAYVLEAGDSPSKLDAAAEHVNQVLETNPRNVQALLLAGRINMLKGQPARAQASYQAAAAADPNSAAAYLGIGEAWSRLGNDEQASVAYNEYRRLSGMKPLAEPGSEPPPALTPGQAPPVIVGPGRQVTPSKRERR